MTTWGIRPGDAGPGRGRRAGKARQGRSTPPPTSTGGKRTWDCPFSLLPIAVPALTLLATCAALRR